VVFWLREGNQPLTPYSTLSAASKYDPPLGPDMATIEVDTTGKLVGLAATAKGRRGARADFPKLLRLAGFAASSLKSVPPRAMPQLFADERMAWDGVWPDDRGKPAHIEAAAAGGVPVFLQITGPWDDDQGAVGRQPFSTPVLATFLTALATVLAVLVIILAGRNLRGRRGDRSGATRVAVAVFCLEVCISLLRGDHRAAFSHERSIVASAFGDGLFSAAAFFLLYIALEPYVRRRWPERLIAWSRLLAGNLRNPLVGRDLLIGIAAGLAHATLASLSNWLPGRLGLILPQPPLTGHLDALLGVRHVLRGVLVAAGSGIFIGMGLIVILVVLAIVFRSRPAAAIALFVLQLAGFALAAAHSPYVFAASIVIAVIWTAVTVRVGLLGIATAQTVFGVAFFLPLSVGASSWMLPITMVPILFIAFLAAFAFRTALGGQPMFSANLLDE
jgi:serine/threonine-protein kinase